MEVGLPLASSMGKPECQVRKQKIMEDSTKGDIILGSFTIIPCAPKDFKW